MLAVVMMGYVVAKVFIGTNLNGSISYKAGITINGFDFKTYRHCVHYEIDTLLVTSMRILSFLRIFRYPNIRCILCNPKVSVHYLQESATDTIHKLILYSSYLRLILILFSKLSLDFPGGISQVLSA